MVTDVLARGGRGRLFLGLSAAVCMGWVFDQLRVPLPWMLGPMFCVTLLNIADVRVMVPPQVRYLGQWIIGIALGLYFSPAVIQKVAGLWWVIVLTAIGTLAFGVLCAQITRKLANVTFSTAYFAAMPGGAMEMTVLAERHGAAVPLVAAAQCLRVLLVVSIVPLVYRALQLHGADPYVGHGGAPTFLGLLVLFLVTLPAALFLYRRRTPNAWMLGPLAVCACLTAFGVDTPAIPAWLSALGQFGIGVALGSRFERGFLSGAPTFIAAVLAGGALLTVLCLCMAAAVSRVSALPLATSFLAVAPGGIAEMSLTAKVLELGTPVVVAFQVSRLATTLIFALPLYKRLIRLPMFRE